MDSRAASHTNQFSSVQVCLRGPYIPEISRSSCCSNSGQRETEHHQAKKALNAGCSDPCPFSFPRNEMWVYPGPVSFGCPGIFPFMVMSCLVFSVTRYTPPASPPLPFRRHLDGCFRVLMKIRHSAMHGRQVKLIPEDREAAHLCRIQDSNERICGP